MLLHKYNAKWTCQHLIWKYHLFFSSEWDSKTNVVWREWEILWFQDDGPGSWFELRFLNQGDHSGKASENQMITKAWSAQFLHFLLLYFPFYFLPCWNIYIMICSYYHLRDSEVQDAKYLFSRILLVFSCLPNITQRATTLLPLITNLKSEQDLRQNLALKVCEKEKKKVNILAISTWTPRWQSGN